MQHRELVELVTHAPGIENEGNQQGRIDRRERDVVMGEDAGIVFDVVTDLQVPRRLRRAA